VFDSIPIEEHARVVDVNLKGVIYGSHLALQQFRKQGYGATKAAILGLDRALNEELRLTGVGDRIKVSTIMPYGTDTPFFDHAANYTGRTAREPMLDPPEKVVDYIVYASLHPREEVLTGWKARSAYWSHRITPDVTEYINGSVSQASQMEHAPLTQPPTSGALTSRCSRAPT
jgi:short-subunit dehydrogenase